jgi:hypothetical protein
MAPRDALAAASYCVEPLSPMAPRDALAAASYGFRLFAPLATQSSGSDRLGTIDNLGLVRMQGQSRLFHPGSPPLGAG